MSDDATKNYIDLTTSNSSSNITLNTSYSHTWPIGSSLTPEEKDELARLKAEELHLLEQKRLMLFKQLSPELRQHILNTIMIDNFLDSLDNAVIDELDLKQRINSLSSRDGISIGSYLYDSATYNIHRILKYLTVDELVEAHAAQTLEEELIASTDSIKKHE